MKNQNNDWDYGYLKHAILDICIEKPLSIKNIDKELRKHGYNNEFKCHQSQHLTVCGNTAILKIVTPKGLKEFKITVTELRN